MIGCVFPSRPILVINRLIDFIDRPLFGSPLLAQERELGRLVFPRS
jgi:hypothetical protein